MKFNSVLMALPALVFLATGCEVNSKVDVPTDYKVKVTYGPENGGHDDCGGDAQGPMGPPGMGGGGRQGGGPPPQQGGGGGRPPGGGPGGGGGGGGGGGNCQRQGQGSSVPPGQQGSGGESGGGQGFPPPPLYPPRGQGHDDREPVSFEGRPVSLNYRDNIRYVIVDRNGRRWAPGPQPYALDCSLAETRDQPGLLEEADAEVFKIISPIRDVLMYLPDGITNREWARLTRLLEDLQIRTVSLKIGPREQWHLSNEDVLAYARENLGRGPIRPIADYLAEAELALKCYFFDETGEDIDLRLPDGEDYCHERLGLNTRMASRGL